MKNFNFNNKTIVLLIKVAVLGGAERQALGLADYLIKKHQCKVHLVATHSNVATEEFSAFAKECGITKIDYFGPPSLTIKNEFSLNNLKKTVRALKYLHLMKKQVSKYKPDMLIPFLNTPSKIAALIYKSTGAKTTFWHQLGLDNYTFDIVEKTAIKRTPFILANAANGLDVFKEKYNVPENKLFVLPQYVSIKKTMMDKLALKKEFLIDNEAVVIGMIAHYREEKYHGLLLNAFSKVAQSRNVHLVLLGNKDNSEETLNIYNQLNEQTKALDLQTKVSVLTGYPVEKILNLLDIGVLVSQIEGTPNVVMEYMLYGLPVIATNHSGCINLLEESAFLIANDETIISGKLEQLIDDKALRLEEGKSNGQKIKKFSIENYFTELNAIINSTL